MEKRLITKNQPIQKHKTVNWNVHSLICRTCHVNPLLSFITDPWKLLFVPIRLLLIDPRTLALECFLHERQYPTRALANSNAASHLRLSGFLSGCHAQPAEDEFYVYSHAEHLNAFHNGVWQHGQNDCICPPPINLSVVIVPLRREARLGVGHRINQNRTLVSTCQLNWNPLFFAPFGLAPPLLADFRLCPLEPSSRLHVFPLIPYRPRPTTFWTPSINFFASWFLSGNGLNYCWNY